MVSCEGSSLSFWARLADEGYDVCVFIEPWAQNHVGDGIVKKAGSFEALRMWAAQDKTIWLFDGSGQGKRAEALRSQGELVVGGGVFADRLEGDRAWAEKAAQVLGIPVPDTKEFKTISAAINFLKSLGSDEREWYFKTNQYLDASATFGGVPNDSLIRYLEYARKRYRDNLSCILQEKIDGVAVSTGAWFNGQTFLTPIEGTLEHKKFLNSDLGPATGCSFNALWFYETYPKIAKELKIEELGDLLRKMNAPAGIYDINSVVSKKDKTPYFLEFTPRFGYDSEPTGQRALTMDLGEFLYGLATRTLKDAPFRTDTVQLSTRLSVPPYPWEAIDGIPEKHRCVGTPVWGADSLWGDGDSHFIAYGLGLDDEQNLVVKDPLGMVGLAITDGLDMRQMSDEILTFIKKKLQVPGLQYRTDFGKVISKDLAELAKLGYVSHPRLKLMEE